MAESALSTFLLGGIPISLLLLHIKWLLISYSLCMPTFKSGSTVILLIHKISEHCCTNSCTLFIDPCFFCGTHVSKPQTALMRVKDKGNQAPVVHLTWDFASSSITPQVVLTGLSQFKRQPGWGRSFLRTLLSLGHLAGWPPCWQLTSVIISRLPFPWHRLLCCDILFEQGSARLALKQCLWR